MTTHADVFERHRGRLTGLASRLLGSVSDAEDVVQEAYLRWCRAHGRVIETPAAFLTVVVQRLCADHRRAAAARREAGPDALLTVPSGGRQRDPGFRLETAESVSSAFRAVLDTLSPLERAAYLLRRIFNYGYSSIAALLDKSEGHCRQLVHRAECQLRGGRPPIARPVPRATGVAEAFLHTCATGDLAGLLDRLTADASNWGGWRSGATSSVRPSGPRA
jgi:RNA polymerase sigma-70 factor (ECF subfamily)